MAILLQGSGKPAYNSAGSGISDQGTDRTRSLALAFPSRVKFDFAPELPPGLLSPTDFAGTWWIAEVRKKDAAAVCEHYAAKGIAWCIPQTIVTTRYTTSRNRRTKRIPLFDGYVPACVSFGTEASLYPQHGGVRKVIRISDQNRFVFQLDQVFRANQISPLDPWPWAIEGKRCKVRTGEFQGMIGIVIRRKDGCSSVILELGKLGGAAIPRDFSLDELEPCD